MLRLERDRLPSRNVPLDTPNAPGLCCVVPFRPIATSSSKPSFRQLGKAGASHSTGVEADIIPLQPRHLAARTRSAAVPMSRVMDKYTRTDVGHPRESIASEGDDRQRTFENLAVVAWVATLMATAFYVFSKLLGV